MKDKLEKLEKCLEGSLNLGNEEKEKLIAQIRENITKLMADNISNPKIDIILFTSALQIAKKVEATINKKEQINWENYFIHKIKHNFTNALIHKDYPFIKITWFEAVSWVLLKDKSPIRRLNWIKLIYEIDSSDSRTDWLESSIYQYKFHELTEVHNISNWWARNIIKRQKELLSELNNTDENELGNNTRSLIKFSLDPFVASIVEDYKGIPCELWPSLYWIDTWITNSIHDNTPNLESINNSEANEILEKSLTLLITENLTKVFELIDQVYFTKVKKVWRVNDWWKRYK